MPFQIQRRFSLFDGTSANSTATTSNAQFVGDYAYMTVSWASDTSVASRLTLEASNDDGFSAAITNWSAITGITVAGAYTVDPGFRWIRGIRNSNESLAIVDMFGRT